MDTQTHMHTHTHTHRTINMFRYVRYEHTSKEKHSLTRKLVGYRNWRQRWCKKEGNKVFGKG